MAAQLLIRAPNHLGDCIMSLPMVNDAREAYPGVTVTLIAPKGIIDLFQNNLSVDHLLPIEDADVHGWRGVFRLKEIIARQQYDIGYILPPSFGSVASFKLAGVRERIGYISDGRRLLLTRPLPLSQPVNAVHRSQLYYNLLRRGSGRDLTFSPPRLVLNDNDFHGATELLKQFSFDADKPFAAVAFQSVAPSRRWGEDNYTALVKHLILEFKIGVVLIGSSAEQEMGERIMERVGDLSPLVNLAGRTSVRELAAILAKARLFVGNDSGPAHVAAAAGTSLVVLSGADDPRETSPLSGRKAVIIREDLECISCGQNVCPRSGEDNMRCMKEISLVEVADAVQEYLNAAV